MASTLEMAGGNYSYIPAVFQYSAGIAAAPGYAIERVRFSRPVPLAEGFERIAALIKAAGRPLTAFCACELRSPGQFSEEGFRAFNKAYVEVLAQWGIFAGERNPVARSNVCPEVDPPSEPGFHAFAFTVPAPDAPRSFVIAGSGEAPENKGNYKDNIIRRGDVSTEGMREKARFVLGEMERRMGLFDAGWRDVTAVQLYTVHDVHPLLAEEFGRRGALRQGLTWHYNRPPVLDLDFEMDCRCVHRERVHEV